MSNIQDNVNKRKYMEKENNQKKHSQTLNWSSGRVSVDSILSPGLDNQVAGIDPTITDENHKENPCIKQDIYDNSWLEAYNRTNELISNLNKLSEPEKPPIKSRRSGTLTFKTTPTTYYESPYADGIADESTPSSYKPTKINTKKMKNDIIYEENYTLKELIQFAVEELEGQKNKTETVEFLKNSLDKLDGLKESHINDIKKVFDNFNYFNHNIISYNNEVKAALTNIKTCKTSILDPIINDLQRIEKYSKGMDNNAHDLDSYIRDFNETLKRLKDQVDKMEITF
jgi:hypothetical protein